MTEGQADTTARRRVAVVGATSQIAQFLLPRLQAAGHESIPITRGATHAFGRPAHVWHPHSERLQPPCGTVDAVITTAPLSSIADVLRVATSLSAGHIIAIGSMSRVSKAASSNAAERQTAADLAGAETQLKDMSSSLGLTWTLLRPTMIYGSGRDRNVAFIARFIRRFGVFFMPAGANGMRQPVHADDVAAACVAAVHTAGARNQAFDIGGGERLGYRTMVERIFVAMNRRPRILPLPKAALRLAGTVGRWLPPLAFIRPSMIDRMSTDLIANNDRASTLLGYTPRGFAPDDRALGRLTDGRHTGAR